jgi:DNA-binding NtrC family response regulator
MVAVRHVLARVAATPSPVLIEGESGTGKEVAAAALHRLSGRTGPFIPVNCGALPRELMESEFFGHVRGAFSGAVSDTQGLFRSAHGGTLFLDEVGELPVDVQAKLLRVLQDKEVRPVGAARIYSVDVRIVAATNRDLEQAVRAGVLRQDLFFRLNVVRLRIAPLRDRRDDVTLLTAFFLERFNQRFGRNVRRLEREAAEALTAYDFPGNVRELENILERAYAMGADGEIGLQDLPLLASTPRGPTEARELPTLAEMERELIQRALRLHGGDRERAARAIGLSPRTLYRRLKDYKLD